jgi:hypothetical protein
MWLVSSHTEVNTLADCSTLFFALFIKRLVMVFQVTGGRQAAELRRLAEEVDQLQERLASGDSENIHKVS